MAEIDDIIDLEDRPKELKGRLIICPTPIGNIRDITIRQYEALLESDIIACEDTRVTGKLFKMFKEKRIREKFYENFDLEVNEIKDVTIDDFEVKEEEDFFDTIGESESIKKYKKILNEMDSLGFLGRTEEMEDEDMYGLEDQFILAMRRKIAEIREKKGRGLMVSYFKHNEDIRLMKLIKCLQYNFTVALVSDAGTPTISDPGYKLINEAHKENILIESLPGPNSVSVGLSSSGFPADNFVFEGYVSKTPSLKISKLEKAKELGLTCVLFESKARVMRTLLTLEKIYGDKQQIFIGMELTKMHETLLRGTISEVYEKLSKEERHREIRGEITMVIAPWTAQYNEGLREKEEEGSEDEEINPLVKVKVENLVKTLHGKLEAKDKEIAEIMGKMLSISKNKAMTHLSAEKYKHTRTLMDKLLKNARDYNNS
jgi:16S rRNA (cytidine1402-2'-O)-methyltransferase